MGLDAHSCARNSSLGRELAGVAAEVCIDHIDQGMAEWTGPPPKTRDRALPAKNHVAVPLQQFRIGLGGRIARLQDLLAVKVVVNAPVRPIFFEMSAYGEHPIGLDRDEAEIEEAMKITSQQKPVAHFVRSALGVWLDMGSFENRQGVLCRDGACAIVCVKHRETEAALSEPGTDNARRSVAIAFVEPRLSCGGGRSCGAVVPQSPTGAGIEIVDAAAHRASGPIVRLVDPLVWRKKGRKRDRDASDCRVQVDCGWRRRQSGD